MKFLVGMHAVPCACGSEEWSPLDARPTCDDLAELLCAQCGNVQLAADLVLQAPLDAPSAAMKSS